ncbi:hypothetical protein ILUMI_12155 [Ignelater luminosus]|uniref:DDE-1 domain-containing protein n=1 Tax=Ignelater luminosus TaxID=2038154 RepID=A0A8K0D041_IGNLU|nr:hypothetical protein ILUMI_12155 [Ignelater luminosus]
MPRNMTRALQEVLKWRIGYKKATRTFSIAQSTLHERVKKTRQQERLFGLTLHDLRRLAFKLAERNSLPNNFNKTTQMAGKDWLYGFLNRHRNISLRDPEKTSIARAKGFNCTAVSKFYDLLNSMYEKHNFFPNDIYKVDETGILTVPIKQGVLVTAEACMNAAGNFMSPMFVFPRKRENSLSMDDAPPGSFAYYHESGWINAESFLYWFKRFIEYANPSPQKPLLLILDVHRSHSKSMALIDLARENNVTLLYFPLHTTHRLQSLDALFMAPLSAYYEQEVRRWMVAHHGRAVIIYQIGKLLTAAFTRGAVMQTAITGFKKTRIFPFNRNVFPEHLFAPSETTERPQTAELFQAPKDLELQPSTSSCGSSFSTSPMMLMPPPQEEQRNWALTRDCGAANPI